MRLNYIGLLRWRWKVVLDSMKLGTYSYGVAIYPNENVRLYINDLVSELSKKVSFLFHVDSTHIPHITLFQGGFNNDPKNLISSLNIPKGRPVIKMKDMLFLHPTGNIFWNVECTKEIQSFHEEIARPAKLLTQEHYMQQWIDRCGENGDLNKTQIELVREFGFAESGIAYLPHITIGRLTNLSDWLKIKDTQLLPIKFLAEKVIAGPVSYFGNVERIDTIW